MILDSIKKTDVYILFVLIFISTIPLFTSLEIVRKYSSSLFLLYSLLVFFSVYKDKKLVLFCSPAILCILYISISSCVGAFAFYNNLVIGSRTTISYKTYLELENLPITTSYILLSNSIVFAIDLIFRDKLLKLQLCVMNEHNHAMPLFFIMLVLVAPIAFISEEYSIIPKTACALILIYQWAWSKQKYRVILYLALLVVFSISSVESKREAIFLVFPILLLEAFFQKGNISLSLVLKGILGAIFILILIILMSIARGYGGFEEVNGLVSAIPYLFEYIKSEIFLAALFNNIEATSVYYNAVQSMDYVQDDLSIMSAGSTIAKALFVFIPRSLWEDKPSSVIELYTRYHDPAYRAIGGSDPIHIYAELFWNFGYLSLIFLPVLFLIVMILFRKLLVQLIEGKIFYIPWGLFVYMNFVTYVRGSGLDMYLAFTLIAFGFTLLAILLLRFIFVQKVYL